MRRMYHRAARPEGMRRLRLAPHHAQSIARVVEHFRNEDEVEALLLGGSLAHGFSRPESDVNLLIVISDQRYAERSRLGQLYFYSTELCTYPGGYVDGKYVAAGFLREIAERGSEP